MPLPVAEVRRAQPSRIRTQKRRNRSVSAHEPADISPQARFWQDQRTQRQEGDQARPAVAFCRAEACSPAATLRLSPGARWDAEELGDTQGPESRSERKATGRARRGPSARVRRL